MHCCILLDFSLWIVLWCTDPRTSRRFVVSIASRPLYSLGASPQYLMNRSVDGPQIRCGRHGEERNVITYLGFGRPVRSVVEKPIVQFRFPRLICTACVLPAMGSGGQAESQNSPISAPYFPDIIRIGLHQQNCPHIDFSVIRQWRNENPIIRTV
jgi:hypothetical protein